MPGQTDLNFMPQFNINLEEDIDFQDDKRMKQIFSNRDLTKSPSISIMKIEKIDKSYPSADNAFDTKAVNSKDMTAEMFTSYKGIILRDIMPEKTIILN